MLRSRFNGPFALPRARAIPLREALFERLDPEPQALVIGHHEGGKAADHREDRGEQRPLVLKQQGYAQQKTGDSGEGRQGKPVPARAGTIANTA